MKTCIIASALVFLLGIEVLSMAVLACWAMFVLPKFIAAVAAQY